MSRIESPRTKAPIVASAPEPGVELVLDSPLDDQLRPEPRELRERLPRVLADSDGEQLVDLLLDLRRRRYGSSCHGVGLLSWSCRTLGNLRRWLDGSSAIYIS